MLKCGHSFCSICIRKSLDKVLNQHRTTTYTQCPSCREKADSSDLIPNRTLAVVVTNYKTMRKGLFSFISQTTNTGNNSTYIDSNSNKLASSSASSCKSHGIPIIKRMPHYNFHGMTKEKIRKTIENITKESKIKLRMDGDKEVTMDHLLVALLGCLNLCVYGFRHWIDDSGSLSTYTMHRSFLIAINC